MRVYAPVQVSELQQRVEVAVAASRRGGCSVGVYAPVQVSELQQRVEVAVAASRRLESEADQQMAQITELQERLLAAETSGRQLTASCVEKDVKVSHPI